MVVERRVEEKIITEKKKTVEKNESTVEKKGLRGRVKKVSYG